MEDFLIDALIWCRHGLDKNGGLEGYREQIQDLHSAWNDEYKSDWQVFYSTACIASRFLHWVDEQAY